MTARARSLLLACALFGLARPALAQDSQFGIQGLGTPGRDESVASRSAGGALTPFDGASVLDDASLVDLPALSSTVALGTSYRQVEAPNNTNWLRTVRYPLFSVGGKLGHRLYIGGGFSTYLDRTYSVATRDSIMLRGVSEAFNDQVSSNGGVGDLRLTVATRFGPHVALGLGAHLLAGSTQELATRRFDDTLTYAVIRQTAQVRYDGFGISGGALVDLTSSLSIALFGRHDGRLDQYVGDTLTLRSDLPNTIGGAVRWVHERTTRVAASVVWRSWSQAAANAYNTLNWSVGVDLGDAKPLRFGVRGGQLPFGPGPGAPSEWGVSLGTGRKFAKGRGLLDFGIERLSRDGGGLHENVWTALIGMTVRP